MRCSTAWPAQTIALPVHQSCSSLWLWAVGSLAVARLADSPWYFQRNILLLIGRLGHWPDGFTPKVYAANPDARIRREAIKLLLESHEHTADGILLGLRDTDNGIVALAA